MAKRCDVNARAYGAAFKKVNLNRYFNWPPPRVNGEWWQKLAVDVLKYPEGNQASWGIPFQMGQGRGPRVILMKKGSPEIRLQLDSKADFLCLLHEWQQIPETVKREDPTEGLVVGEYELTYTDETKHLQPVRARFEVAMVESPGPVWLALPFHMWKAIDPAHHPREIEWGAAQRGVITPGGSPWVYAMPNPYPNKRIHSLTIRALQPSPLLIVGLTLYQGASHPLRHLPRRTYHVNRRGASPEIEKAGINLGGIARLEETKGPRGKPWLSSPYIGLSEAQEPVMQSEKLVEAFGSEDATLSVKLAGQRRSLKFSLGDAFHRGQASADSGTAKLQVLGKTRQWMRVVIKDSSTGKPVPIRIHFSGARGEYIAPYGHHAQINTGWFMDYGADVVAGGQNFAYVPGEFTTDMPVGEVYVEMYKGFEYQPVRKKVSIKPGQKVLELTMDRGTDWRSRGWVTADTHVHFISPHTAWLQGQCEGVNIVNLLASQWGRLFTNVGDFRGKVGIVEEDTIVYVGTENRNHMLGHMSMLGTKGLPVFPMCGGGPGEAWVGDPDFVTMAEWALENKRKGGIVIRPHFPFCGYTEDPVPILKGLVDALEIRRLRGEDFPTQEWYRYLNCGYRVAVVGGTDKMGAYCPLGWLRTYALLDPDQSFSYAHWAEAVRAGRTFSTTGPLIDMTVDGQHIGDTLQFPASGGTVEVESGVQSCWPLGKIEIVHNGRVVAEEHAQRGSKSFCVKTKIKVLQSGWIAARCSGWDRHPSGYMAAHTSPIYLKCGTRRAFDTPAAQHMLALVEGGTEYLETLSTVFDENSKKRMVKLFKEVQQELKGRLMMEGRPIRHHGQEV